MIVFVVLAWQCASSAARVIGALGDRFSTTSSWSVQLVATFRGFLSGWPLAVGVGIVACLAMGMAGAIRDALEPLIMGFHAMTQVALMPLRIVWSGFVLEYKLAVGFIASIFFVLLNTIGAVQDDDEQLARMSCSSGAKRRQVIAAVVLPGARSAILVGVRRSVPFPSREGVGYVINQAAQLGLANQLFAAGDAPRGRRGRHQRWPRQAARWARAPASAAAQLIMRVTDRTSKGMMS